MTREEAIKKCLNSLAMKPIELGDIKASQLIDMLEKLGLLKFEEKKEKIIKLFDCFGSKSVIDERANHKIVNDYRNVRLELWPEGLVLWVGGEIVWKSWEKYYKKGDRVQLHDSFGGFISGIIKE